jgi:hypothetical protein
LIVTNPFAQEAVKNIGKGVAKSVLNSFIDIDNIGRSILGKPERERYQPSNQLQADAMDTTDKVIILSSFLGRGGAAGTVMADAKETTVITSSVSKIPKGKQPGPTIDPLTGEQVQRFVGDARGNVMIEPQGGATVSAGKGGVDTHTTYNNGSNYQRLNSQGHANNPKPHGHGHKKGTGPGKKGQGPSIDNKGRVVPNNSKEAHWDIH